MKAFLLKLAIFGAIAGSGALVSIPFVADSIPQATTPKIDTIPDPDVLKLIEEIQARREREYEEDYYRNEMLNLQFELLQTQKRQEDLLWDMQPQKPFWNDDFWIE